MDSACWRRPCPSLGSLLRKHPSQVFYHQDRQCLDATRAGQRADFYAAGSRHTQVIVRSGIRQGYPALPHCLQGGFSLAIARRLIATSHRCARTHSRPSTCACKRCATQHVRLALSSRTGSLEVRASMRQLQRSVTPAKIDRSVRVRTPPKHKESRQVCPLTRALLERMLDAIGANALDRPDRCLFLLGFSAALSRSTLIALDLGDVNSTNDAMLAAARESTREPGNGAERHRVIAVPRTRRELCAARATSEWIPSRPVGRTGRPVDSAL